MIASERSRRNPRNAARFIVQAGKIRGILVN